MKTPHPITIERARAKEPPGGAWQTLDPVSKGRVQVLTACENQITQAMAVMTELQRLAGLSGDWEWSKSAIIAREWKYLNPVRSYCELHEIPVQIAYEESPHFWRLRETAALIRWLRELEAKLLQADTIHQWLNQQSTGLWFELLREAVEAYALETSDVELPKEHFIEWLAEWGHEVRRRQTGLMLLTAHRAKGLEFDHVAVLDGGWNVRSDGEDPDAQRRLYYVAMTRARQTLTLARMQGGNILLDGLSRNSSILRRRSGPLPQPPVDLANCYVRLTLRELDLGYAGRFVQRHPIHRAIAELRTGDRLSLREEQGRLELTNPHGQVVGRLARGYQPPRDMVCMSAQVAAICWRRKEDADPEFLNLYRSESWELVVPELVYAPA